MEVNNEQRVRGGVQSELQAEQRPEFVFLHIDPRQPGWVHGAPCMHGARTVRGTPYQLLSEDDGFRQGQSSQVIAHTHSVLV